MQSILIIEDDETIRKELKTLLEKYGYHVIAIDDFGNVINLVFDKNPHLLLIDLNLPVYDGYHICREIRKKSKIPIIVVTSRDNEFDELMSINLGADDFITKPYNTQILLARIATLLRRSYGEDVLETIRYQGIMLDIGRSTMRYQEHCIELTKNELRILHLLIKNKGKITSREDIMNELWQSDEFVDDNTLTVNINRLRKKMSEIGLVDMLKTKRGQGYSL